MASHTEHAPWTVVDADRKKRARLNCIKHILRQIDYTGRRDGELLRTNDTVVYDADRMIAAFDEHVALIPEKQEE